MICPSCSRENRDNARFCDECGADLVAIEEGPVLSDGSVSFTGFVGRQREMGELRTALQDAISGQGRLVMLVGICPPNARLYRYWARLGFTSRNNEN